MNHYKLEIIQTVILLLILIVIVQLVKKAIRRFSLLKSLDPNRRQIILKLSNFLFYLLFVVALVIIWGVDLDQFTLFISSVLAVLGVGFFAQWSILSNLTASVILFFSHPVRIGDRIKIMDKDFDWVGEVKNISGFFLFMKTDKGENITIPTSLVLQKGIEILSNEGEVFKE